MSSRQSKSGYRGGRAVDLGRTGDSLDFVVHPDIEIPERVLDLATRTVRLRHRDFLSFEFALRFGADGELEAFTMERRPGVEGGPLLNRNTVKVVPLGFLEREARRFLRWATDPECSWRYKQYGKWQALSVSTAARAPRKHVEAAWASLREDVKTPAAGSRQRGDLWYAELARDYVAAHEAGLNTTQTLADARNYDEATIRNAVWQARKRGFLTRTEQGRQGGQLTDKSRRLLGGTDG
jgi:hypothetical protein